MAYQGIGTGTTPNDNTGDSLLIGALKINSNFEEIYNALGDGTTLGFVEKAQDAVGAAINAGIQTGIVVTYDDVNNTINFANYTITTTSIDKELSNLEYCTVTTGGVTLALPPSPTVGNKVMIGISSNYTDTVITGNGSNIMGLEENMIIDVGYVTLTLIYINNTFGWRIS